MSTQPVNRAGLRSSGRLAVIFLILLVSLTSGVASAQTDETPDDGNGSDAGGARLSIEISVTEITDPGALSVNTHSLQIHDLTGQAAVSGDISGAATTDTNITWSGPCNPETLACRGVQVSRQQLTITDDSGEWHGHLQLTLDPAAGGDAISGVLVGRRGHTGEVIFIDTVTARTDSSLTVTGNMAGRAGARVQGINLRSQVCLNEDLTGSGVFLSNSATIAGGTVDVAVTGALDANGMLDAMAGISVTATFMNADGTLAGQAMENSTAAGFSGRFAIHSGDGAYAGVQGYGRTGSQLISDANCGSGYALSSFWIGELYTDSADS